MKCLACGNTEFVKGLEIPVFNKSITIYRCNFCDLIFSHPLPTKHELEQYYSSGEAQDHSGFHLNLLIEKHEKFVQSPPQSYLRLKDLFIQNTKKVHGRGNCLEIGCNLGVFIELVQPISNLNFYGIEFNSEAVDFVKARGKFMIDSKSIEDEPFPGVQFDSVIIFDVLEHIPEPIQFINTIKKRLTSQGIILLVVPNASAWSYKLLRFFKKLRNQDVFPTVEPPFHLYGYSYKNLKLIFNHCDFEIIYYGFYLMEHFYIQHMVSKDMPFNLNREIGNLLSKIKFITRDDKIVCVFRKVAQSHK